MTTLVLCGSRARASEFHAFDRASQIRASEVIVTAKVLATRSYWTTDRSAIVTDAEVLVEEAWKGAPAERILVRTLGGAVDAVVLKVDGAATFEAGERVVLFLEPEGDAWAPAGMIFGKLRIAGLPGDAFAIGSLPPSVPGGARYETVSVSLDELRAEVGSVAWEAR